MSSKIIYCQNCNAPLTVKPFESVVQCQYCQNNQVIETNQSNSLSFDASYYREKLVEAAQSNNLKEIERLSNKIIEHLPNDVLGLYFYAHTQSIHNNLKPITQFLTSQIDLGDFHKSIIEHLIHWGDLREKENIARFIRTKAPSSQKTFVRIQNERIQAENHYVNIPRDIFVCYSSKNKLIVEELVTFLEKEGYKCWYSDRNLRPEGGSQYWFDIEKAMINTKLMVVISSEFEMLSPDVRKEIDLAKLHHKPLIELKLDLTPHNAFFKHTFEGIQWINGYDDLYQGYEKLRDAVRHKIKDLKVKEKEQNERHTPIHKQKTKKEFLFFVALILMVPIILVLMIAYASWFPIIYDLVSQVIS